MTDTRELIELVKTSLHKYPYLKPQFDMSVLINIICALEAYEDLKRKADAMAGALDFGIFAAKNLPLDSYPKPTKMFVNDACKALSSYKGEKK